MTRPDTLTALFHRLATRFSHASALSAPDREALSFLDLYSLIEKTRLWLSDHGFGPEDRIALAVAERPEMAAAFIATTCSALAVPLNPDATRHESEALLAHLGVDALVASASSLSASREAARRLGIGVIDLSPLPQRPAGWFRLEGETYRATASQNAISDADIAFFMTTSGTTNAPKIVPISHRLAVTRAFTEAAAFRLDSGDCCLNFRPLYLHSGLNAGLLVPLSAGGCVVLPPDFDAHTFPGLLRKHNVTWFLGNPAYNEAILKRFEDCGAAGARSHLRFIRSSSYRLPPEQMAALEDLFGVPVLERYGGTEAGIIARNPLPPEERRPGTVGRAVDSEVAIMDDCGKPLPAGETGEIAVRGRCVIGRYGRLVSHGRSWRSR